jgi:hypothetical protein
MPEPEIACETIGNSTECGPKMLLQRPAIPMAERMPPIPAKRYVEPTVEISVEFADFGVSKIVSVNISSTVGHVIALAGDEFGVLEWHVQLIRNAGAEIPLSRLVDQLEDDKQIIVYLICALRDYSNALIVRLPLCEELGIKHLEVRVEVPETDDVFFINALSSDTVGGVMLLTPIPSNVVDKVTYNGARVELNLTLEYLHFADKSALIVYLIPMPLLPPPLPVQSPAPSANLPPTLYPADANNQGSPAQPVPVFENDDWPRPIMTSPAVVTVHFEAYPHLDFPVIVSPGDSGMVIFNALRDRTGRPFGAFTLTYRRIKVEFDTSLKELGFVTGDIIPVQMHPRDSV